MSKKSKLNLPRYSRWNRSNVPPVEIIEEYLASQKRTCTWSAHSRKCFEVRIYKFYRWAENSDVALAEITSADLAAYEAFLRGSGIGLVSLIQYRRTINAFIRWMSLQGEIRHTLVDLGLERPDFPLLTKHLAEMTQSYAIKIHKIYVHEFYTFLKTSGIAIGDIGRDDIVEYEKSLCRQSPKKPAPARRINMRCVRSHIHWLAHNGYLRRSIGELGIFKVKHQALIDAQLPTEALDFLRLSLTHKCKRTIAGYKTKLKHFYKFLCDRQISIAQFSRRDFEEFAKFFQETGYSPISTNQAIGTVQIYMTWLYECGHIANDPEPVIGNFPRPRRLDKLPRYLYPEVDELLKKYLRESDHVVSQALYLMRRTGIRISDLRDLRYDCLCKDERGYHYMKVPLGKLNQERLFPLDKESVLVIDKIKKMSRSYNGGHDPENLVIHPRGKPPGDTDYYYVLYEISEKIRLDHKLSLGEEALVSHRLRHTFATTLVNAGIELEALRDLMGHRSLAMTLVYAKVAPTKLRSAYIEALSIIENEIKPPDVKAGPKANWVGAALGEALIRLKARMLEPKTNTKTLRSMIRRVERIKQDLEELVSLG